MTRSAPTAEPLLERERELTRIAEALDATAGGRGGTLLIEGPAGIGKTRLLEHARARAAEQGFAVLHTRASPLERGFGFGVIRGLLEAALRAADADERESLFAGAAGLAAPVLDLARPVPAPTFATLHGVYWQVVALAERRPVVLAVDDAHWADGPSLRALHHVAHRVEDVPVLLVLTVRPSEPGTETALLDAIRDEPSTAVVTPGPLSPAATDRLVRAGFGPDTDAAFCAACHEVADGNPLLLAALVRSLRQAGVVPSAAATAAVHERAPAIISTFVLPRLRHLPAGAIGAARALAILGPGAPRRHVAAVAGLSPEATANALDALVAAELATAEPLGFVHPLVGQAVADRMTPGERHHAHHRAARELATDRAPAEAVAAHLQQVDPLRDPWVVDRLRDAARAALAKGAPLAAAGYLERALAEPPDAGTRVDVLTELGDALCRHGSEDGYDRLTEALDSAVEPARRDRIALTLARRLELDWELPRAFEVLDRALTEIDERGAGDDDAALRIEVEWAGLARMQPARHDAALRRLEHLRPLASTASVAGCVLLANHAVELVQDPERAQDAVAAARQALDGITALRDGPFEIGTLYLTVPVLVAAGALDAAAAAVDRAAGHARASGARIELGAGLSLSAEVAHRRGALFDAEADARLALEIAGEAGKPGPRRLILGYLLPVLVARGYLSDAETELAALGSDPRQAGLLAGVGRLRLAQGRPDEALELLLSSGRRLAERGWRHPGLLPWRTDAALAAHHLGDHDRAVTLADEALREARRFGTPIPLGTALRTRGLVDGDVDALREAVAVLEPTQARLELAHALVELGATLRRANRRAAAREPLRDGLEIAHRSAADALVRRATEELAAAGARPRTPVRTGVEALSASEWRVARLAAEGRTNRDIAQALFVTTKTVEVHLSACYRKLGIASRAELSGALP